MRVRLGFILGMVLVLGACGKPVLHSLRSNSEGPDEFRILPAKPLQEPESFSALPEPTPGGANLVDPRPLDDAIVTFGGRPQTAAGIPASDGAVINHARRFGVPGDIRTSLAAEDEAFRKRRGRLTQIKLFSTDRYKEVYQRQALDAQAETRRFRRVGVQTPSSPPPK